jgi:predicted transcriptional regulator
LFYILIIVTFETNLRIIKLMNNLNTENPNQLEYLNKLVKITVLGGIRIDGLDRMRVTIKIQCLLNSQSEATPPLGVGGLAVRHNLDLYNDTQVEKLIRKTATKLEIGTSVIEASINELIEALEKYRLEQLENTDQKPQTKQLTEKEKSEALQLLQSQNLLTTTNDLIGQSGIIGEETNRLIMYLIFTSRKREQPLHIISLGSSGTGKTHLQESIGNLIPEEEKTEITTLSENAFYYFGQQELKHKLILIEDLDGAESALYPIRELQSKKKISKKIAFKNTKGETKTTNITVEGPVCISGCTTKESVYEDNANRSFLIYLDETTAQDDKIMNYQKLVSANKIDIEQQLKAKAVLQNSQYLLKSIKVINPYAELVELPKEVLKPRRTNAHYLQFIELITHYHQHQRDIKHDEETGEEYIETTIEDIKNANELIKEILIRKADILTGRSRNQLENFKKLLKNKTELFTNTQVRSTLKIAKSTAQYHLNAWLDVGIITKIHDKENQTYNYQFINDKEYKTLENKIDEVLKNIITNIENRTSEQDRPKTQISSVKPKATKEKTPPNE